ncbi:calbindin-32-like protein, partial [Dinothrombium tinctorium]
MERNTSIKNTGKNHMRQFRDPNTGEFRTLTANEFLEMWKNYDTDGNGFIDGKELDKLLLDFMTSLTASKETEFVSVKLFNEFKQKFMQAYDENDNGKIEIKELVHVVPIEQPLSDLLLHHNSLKTSVDFMKVWKKYDADNSGYIEIEELEKILNDFYKETTSHTIPVDKLREYTSLIFEIFDSNKDGKLQLSEVS